MTLYNKTELLEALKEQVLDNKLSDQINIEEVVIDSRKTAKNTLFICIKGENNDGHNYISDAIKNGCNAVLVEDKSSFEKFNNTILVKDSFKSLYEIAKFSRARLEKAKIIAITGSMGKTSTKEIIKTVFSSQGETFATFGNLNNHYGVPLTIANTPRNTEFAIYEMGMNHAGEISELSKLAKPDIAIITGISSAHIENFDNEEGIALAKSEIFDGINQNSVAIINRDNPHYQIILEKAKFKTNNVISFGFSEKSDYILSEINIKSLNLSEILVKNNAEEINYSISTSHKAIIQNSLMALICLKLNGKDFKKGLESFKQIKTEKGRGQLISAQIQNKEITIIDDSYNANLASVKAGIDYLSQLKENLSKKRSVAIIGDILELGNKSQEIHEEILDYAHKNSDIVMTIGDQTQKITKKLYKNTKSYENSKEAATEIENFIQDQDIILIKGSRGIKTEEIIKTLTK